MLVCPTVLVFYLFSYFELEKGQNTNIKFTKNQGSQTYFVNESSVTL